MEKNVVKVAAKLANEATELKKSKDNVTCVFAVLSSFFFLILPLQLPLITTSKSL